MYDKVHVDPDVFILPSKESAFNLLGHAVRKKFGKKYYCGRVVDVVPPDDDEEPEAQLYFTVRYDDGDQEDLTYEELAHILVQRDGDRVLAGLASRSAIIEADFMNEDDNEGAYPPGNVEHVLEEYSHLLAMAARNVEPSTLEEMPYGETYSWMKVSKMPEPRA